MAKKDFTLTSKILMYLLTAGDIFLVTPRELKKRLGTGRLSGDGRELSQTLYYLASKGWIKYVDRNNSRFVKLTRKGELEGLLAKARIPIKPKHWDKKWRVIIFDIPEESCGKRDFFRWLLKKNDYIKLQHSVYINPYPLNREAIDYLKQTGLVGYIRILKVEEMDNDSDLKKKFGLN